MEKVVFICRGNMHRSPTAAGLYNVFKKDKSFAESYGTMVDYEGRAGSKISSYSEFSTLINYLKNNFGVDISNHVCTQVTPKLLQDANKIIVMAEEDYIPDWLRKYKYEHWDVIDDFSTHKKLINDVECIKSKVETLLQCQKII
jgi:protein-tyrosine-phosphatase